MTPRYFLTAVLPAAYRLLPDEMRFNGADALLLAIFLQESRLKHRVQLIGNHRHWWESLKGPARGLPQFERIGIREVLRHPASRPHALAVLEGLGYPEKVGVIHRAVAHNDILSTCLARLLLWADPRALPKLSHPAEVWWRYYLRNWRPGKPHPQTWPEFWAKANREVQYATRRVEVSV